MSKIIDGFNEIYNSPFVVAKYFLLAYMEMTSQKSNILLAYLILPLVLYPESSKFLRNANKRSSLSTFRKVKERIAGLPQRISYYKSITNLCLQYLIDNNLISINDNMSVIVNKEAKPLLLQTSEEDSAAKKIALIFQDIPIQSVYRQLGVKAL